MPKPKQKQLLQFIQDYIDEHGLPPTRREMAAALKLKSPSVINYHLEQLEKEGLVKLSPHVDRGVMLIGAAAESRSISFIPLLGLVSAGRPIETFPLQESIAVPTDMINPRYKNYGLQVKGDSMIDEHICEGDRIVVQSQLVARNGDTVVALVDGHSATVKTIYFENGFIRLQPANKEYEPIIVRPPQTLEIQGLVVGVLRYKNKY